MYENHANIKTAKTEFLETVTRNDTKLKFRNVLVQYYGLRKEQDERK